MAIVGAIYWSVFFLLSESVLTGDYRTGEAPSNAYLTAKVAVVIFVGISLFAVLIAAWRWFDRWLIPDPR